MADQLSGAELDARFFEVCLPSRMARIGVSTDANACEAWAMRWAREQGLYWAIEHNLKDYMTGESYDWACLWVYDGTDPVNQSDGQGTDWKQAFVRACVAAGEILNQAKGGA